MASGNQWSIIKIYDQWFSIINEEVDTVLSEIVNIILLIGHLNFQINCYLLQFQIFLDL